MFDPDDPSLQRRCKVYGRTDRPNRPGRGNGGVGLFGAPYEARKRRNGSSAAQPGGVTPGGAFRPVPAYEEGHYVRNKTTEQ